MENAVKITLVDDHPILRLGIKDFLDALPNFEVVADFQGSTELKEAIQTLETDVLVLDISMPDEDAFRVVNWLYEHYKQIPVIIYSMHNLERYYLHFKATHVSGYVLKSSDMMELAKAITKAVAGKRYFDPKIVGVGQLQEHEENQVQFTAEEQQVLYYLAKKHTNAEIAIHMNLSSQQVMALRKQLLFKANAKNTADLLQFAQRKKNIS